MATFPAVDFATATMRDVIDHSVMMHPSTLDDGVRAAARIHRAAAATMAGPSRAIAARMADGATAWSAEFREDLRYLRAPEHFGLELEVIVFGVAARLQCIPRHVQADIAGRPETRRTKANP